MTDVGYKAPPIETRFQKGQSGNPAGRQKKRQPTVRESILDVLSLPVAARENDKVVQLETLEAMFRQAAANALRGEARPMKELFKLVMDLHQKPEDPGRPVIDMDAARLRMKKALGIDPREPDPPHQEPTEDEIAYKAKCDAAFKRYLKRYTRQTEPARRRLFDD